MVFAAIHTSNQDLLVRAGDFAVAHNLNLRVEEQGVKSAISLTMGHQAFQRIQIIRWLINNRAVLVHPDNGGTAKQKLFSNSSIAGMANREAKPTPIEDHQTGMYASVNSSALGMFYDTRNRSTFETPYYSRGRSKANQVAVSLELTQVLEKGTENSHIKSVTACDFIRALVEDVVVNNRTPTELCHLIIELLDIVDLQKCFKLLLDAHLPHVIFSLIEILETQEERQ